MKDTDFLEWANRDKWELWQAVPLSIGELPLREMTEDELTSEYPEATWVINFYRHYDDETWMRRAIPQSPEEWIFYARGNAPLPAAVPREWAAIFPYSEGYVPEFGKEHEPDYRDFIDAYSRNHRRSLEDLGRFSLSLPENPKFEGKFKRLLLAVNDALPVNQRAKTEPEIPSVVVSTRSFFDNYPSGHRMADLCEDWVYWFKDHPDLLSGGVAPSAATDLVKIANHIKRRFDDYKSRRAFGEWAVNHDHANQITPDSQRPKFYYWFSGLLDKSEEDIKKSRWGGCLISWQSETRLDEKSLRTFHDNYLASRSMK